MANHINVHELGEDGNRWIVMGTSEPKIADEAVRQFVEGKTGGTLEAFFDADDLVELVLCRRDDLAWTPADPKGNRVRGSALIIDSTGRAARQFSGFLVEA
ncbi:hypothetical protein [Glutamicibacter sp. NPDC087344]|uniref:hypothetical protein n=1 Tax=Glutamicibacter sp. NPDC087344 TaxID=3363994 RepID=UPI00382371B4